MAQLGAAGRDHDLNTADLVKLRALIDTCDETIIKLLRRRAALSYQAQQARLNNGEPRLDLNRERVICQRYALLGPAGVDIIAAVLRLCRGAPSDG